MNRYYLKDGYLHYPLTYDTAVLAELETADPDLVLTIEGCRYIRGFPLIDLIRSRPDFQARVAEKLRILSSGRFFNQFPPHIKPLMIAVFQVIPAFTGVTAKEIIHRYLSPEYLERAEGLIMPGMFGQDRLQPAGCRLPLPEGWFDEAGYLEVVAGLENRLINDAVWSVLIKRQQLCRMLQKQYRTLSRKLAVVLRIQDHLNSIAHLGSDALNIGRVGIVRDSGMNWLYLKIDDYNLMDKNQKVYAFPSCRVAVSIENPGNVVVLDRYQHPFLAGNRALQSICFGSAPRSWRVERRALIQNLNYGVQILRTGWPSKSPYLRLSALSQLYIGKRDQIPPEQQQKITNLMNFPDMAA